MVKKRATIGRLQFGQVIYLFCTSYVVGSSLADSFLEWYTSPMDIDFEQVQTYILVGLGIASAVIPLLRHIASLTASKTDDEHVERIAKLIHDALGYVPTIEVSPALTKDEKEALKAKKEESK